MSHLLVLQGGNTDQGNTKTTVSVKAVDLHALMTFKIQNGLQGYPVDVIEAELEPEALRVLAATMLIIAETCELRRAGYQVPPHQGLIKEPTKKRDCKSQEEDHG